MTHREGPAEAAEPRLDETAAESRRRRHASVVRLLDDEVEAPINAAVQDPDIDDKQGTEGG